MVIKKPCWPPKHRPHSTFMLILAEQSVLLEMLALAVEEPKLHPLALDMDMGLL